jgi:hypothetical protein
MAGVAWTAGLTRLLAWALRDGSLALAVIAGCGACPALAEAERNEAPTAKSRSSQGEQGTVADAGGMGQFLDRLMMAESGGRDTAANPRSTALGPFQFIEATFLDVARRHFTTETIKLSVAQVLALRTDRAFSRRAAEAYTRDNATTLAGSGVPPTFANLRLAFLLGAGGAIRVLQAGDKTPAIRIVGAQVVEANPFMAGMTASDLVAWSGRNLAAADLAKRRVAVPGGGPTPPKRPVIHVRCNRDLPSCRRWISLATRRAVKRMPGARPGRKAKR